jgi:hypothetical protein
MTTLEAVTKPGSHVYIATPDLVHRTVPHNIAEWDVVYPSEHLLFFNRKNLELLFARNGFASKHAFRKRTAANSLLFLRQSA